MHNGKLPEHVEHPHVQRTWLSHSRHTRNQTVAARKPRGSNMTTLIFCGPHQRPADATSENPSKNVSGLCSLTYVTQHHQHLSHAPFGACHVMGSHCMLEILCQQARPNRSQQAFYRHTGMFYRHQTLPHLSSPPPPPTNPPHPPAT